MKYINTYKSCMGEILLAADEIGLTGLWFSGAKNYALGLSENPVEKNLDVFKQTKYWLDCYFNGKNPNFIPSLHLIGSSFRKEVWNILLKISYSQVRTYSQIASEIADSRGIYKMSARAVGSAIAHNPISIIVPCHRVVGKNNKMTGYAAGIERKIKLLKLEHCEIFK